MGIDEMLRVLGDLTIKLQEGTDFAEELHRKFGDERIQSRREINRIKEHAYRNCRVVKMNRQTAEGALNDMHCAYKSSHKFISKARKFLKQMRNEDEDQFLIKETCFNDLLIKVQSILCDLHIAVLPEIKEHRNLNNYFESDYSDADIRSDTAGNVSDDSFANACSCNSESENENDAENSSGDSDDENVTVIDRFSLRRRNFMKICKILLLLQTERDNYLVLKDVYKDTV